MSSISLSFIVQENSKWFLMAECPILAKRIQVWLPAAQDSNSEFHYFLGLRETQNGSHQMQWGNSQMHSRPRLLQSQASTPEVHRDTRGSTIGPQVFMKHLIQKPDSFFFFQLTFWWDSDHLLQVPLMSKSESNYQRNCVGLARAAGNSSTLQKARICR